MGRIICGVHFLKKSYFSTKITQILRHVKFNEVTYVYAIPYLAEFSYGKGFPLPVSRFLIAFLEIVLLLHTISLHMKQYRI